MQVGTGTKRKGPHAWVGAEWDGLLQGNHVQVGAVGACRRVQVGAGGSAPKGAITCRWAQGEMAPRGVGWG